MSSPIQAPQTGPAGNGPHSYRPDDDDDPRPCLQSRRSGRDASRHVTIVSPWWCNTWDSKPLAKRALNGAVASERLAAVIADSPAGSGCENIDDRMALLSWKRPPTLIIFAR